MRIALSQFNPTVGDIEGNFARMHADAQLAAQNGADVVVFPEQSITGYPAEDLLYRADFVERAEHFALELDTAVPNEVTILVGTPVLREGAVYNAAVVVPGRMDKRSHGYGYPRQSKAFYAKQHLPNYGVFDENRYFVPGDTRMVLNMREVIKDREGNRAQVTTARLGLSVCEDIWQPNGPVLDSALDGANVMVNLSASPYAFGKPADRLAMLRQRARDTVSWVVYCNMVGGQDELVFDGNSVVIDHTGRVVAQAAAFEEELLLVDIDTAGADAARMRDMRFQRLRADHTPSATERGRLYSRFTERPALPTAEERVRKGDSTDEEAYELYAALVTGTRDYVRKNGLEKVVIGVSGGIDSALVVNIARDALGPENVLGITMPSQYNSSETLKDAHKVCRNVGVDCHEIPIQGVVDSYLHATVYEDGTPLEFEDIPTFADSLRGVAGENLQARVRGNILMGISNSQNRLVLSCGNKSEMAMGYATLYGDMVGGFNPIKDVSKTWVFRLCEHLNALDHMDWGYRIPDTILTRPPSAELAPDQKDTDSLPPYDVLDPLLEAYVERDEDIRGTDLGRKVADKVDFNEYKRRQAPPGVKVTMKAFGRDRRLPLVNKFRGEA